MCVDKKLITLIRIKTTLGAFLTTPIIFITAKRFI